MRIGVIGCGAVSIYCHIPALLRIPGVSITAVADPQEQPRARAARAARAPGFKSAEVLLSRDDVDAVVVATPSHIHSSMAVLAARAGKSFYLEKPIATGRDEARELRTASSESRVKSAVGFNRRHHPLYMRARSLIKSGKIGRVVAAQTAFCEPVPPGGFPRWKQARSTGGGVLLDLASHHVDLLRWIVDAEVSQVSAAVRSDETEQDSATVEMEMSGDVRVQSFYSFRAGYSDRIDFLGESGTVSIDRHRGALVLQSARNGRYGSRRRFLAPTAGEIYWRTRRILKPSEDPSYRAALAAFARGTSSSLATLEDGERSLEAVLAAELSAAMHEAVSVERI